jgi:hypothetical protein
MALVAALMASHAARAQEDGGGTVVVRLEESMARPCRDGG